MWGERCDFHRLRDSFRREAADFPCPSDNAVSKTFMAEVAEVAALLTEGCM